MAKRDIIVIGGSAGAVEPIRTIVAGLPQDLDAAVFVVIHRSREGTNLLAEILDRSSALTAAAVVDGERIQNGRIYVAPSDHHLILEPGIVRLTRGPKENRFRPAIDPLFRSAAQVYGPRAIGVILTGELDDGAAGLWAVKRLGGTAIVQDPAGAYAPSMPLRALHSVDADFCVGVDEIAPLLVNLTRTEADEQRGAPMPDEIGIEVEIAKGKDAIHAGVQTLGSPSSYACPSCHGVLLRVPEGRHVRFRCHTGHAYSIESMLDSIDDLVEASLWSAVRAVEESARLVREMAAHIDEYHAGAGFERLEDKASAADRLADALRRIIVERTQPVLVDDVGGADG
jgi:two-component system chemotaxis response regulator CheB